MSSTAVTAQSAAFVEEVERELHRLLPPEAPGTLLQTGRHLVFAGGRRLRVRLVGACGGLLATPPDRLVAIAAAGEFIHAASLLHDDVVDEAALRRGAPTAHVRFGQAAAVLGGDWLLSQAMEQLAFDHDVVMGAIRTVGEMSAAAIAEVESRGRLAGGLAVWRSVAEGKTGALFGWAAESCARAAGRPESMAGLRAFGRHLGVAFQLADDLLDLVGSAGKDRFSDLRSRTPSYPILHLARGDLDFRRRIDALWSAEPGLEASWVEALGTRLASSDARAATLASLDTELSSAFDALGTGPGAEALATELRALAAAFVHPLIAD